MGTMGTTLLGSAAPRDSDRRDITRICPGAQCQAKGPRGPRGQGDQGTNEPANLNEADTHQAVGDGDEGQVARQLRIARARRAMLDEGGHRVGE
jgi:hypothetical protein